jgi:ubiquinol-cytochrome c reductase cytochrome b subunit
MTDGAPVARQPGGAVAGANGAGRATRAKRGPEVAEKAYEWVDDRLGLSGGGRSVLNKIFPDHWSFMLGEIALYSFIVLVATGIFLTLYFVPSTNPVVYHGPYKPLDGQTLSAAYASTINITFSVRFGLIMRQMHHWGANIFVGSIVVHMIRIFFTGAFRRPRELNWLVGSTLLILAIFNGFLGYSLPDDLVSGTGLRIAFSIMLSVPLVGSYLAFFLFGGNYPGTDIIPRFFILHVLILPLVIIALIAAHLGMLTRHKHTHFKGQGATNTNVVGSPLWPTFAAKTGGFFFLTTGVTALLGGLVQINPIWLYGQYVPYKVTYAVQPDWYMGWLDGALRIMPSWEIVFPGHMIPNAFFPGVLLPGVTFTMIMAWPFLEARFTGDHAEHHLLDRPRDRPLRTSIGAAVLAFYLVLFGASATDVLANYLQVSLNNVLWSFRFLAIIVPLIVFPVAWKVCLELQATPGAGKRKHPTVVLRSAEGGYASIATEIRPGDGSTAVSTPVSLDDIDFEPAVVGARVGASDGAAGDGSDGHSGGLPGTDGDGGVPVAADGDGDGAAPRRGIQGIFKIPRQYR